MQGQFGKAFWKRGHGVDVIVVVVRDPQPFHTANLPLASMP